MANPDVAERSRPNPSQERLFALLVGAIFCVSGAPALIYQVAWQRILALHTGVGVYSVATIVTMYSPSAPIGTVWLHVAGLTPSSYTKAYPVRLTGPPGPSTLTFIGDPLRPTESSTVPSIVKFAFLYTVPEYPFTKRLGFARSTANPLVATVDTFVARSVALTYSE